MATVQHLPGAGLVVGASPSYSLSNLVLKSILPTHYYESRALLYWLEAMLQVYAAFKKLHPSTYRQELGPLDLDTRTLAETWTEIRYAQKKSQDHPLGAIVLELLNKLFPVDEDIVYQDMVEGEGDGFPSIWVMPQNHALCCDDIEDMLQHIDEQGEDVSLTLFFILLDHQYGEEAWEACRSHFGWPVGYLDIATDKAYIDDRRLRFLLKKDGLFPFYDHYMATVYATGNPFVDFDEYGNDRQWELNVDNILRLKKYWEQAQRILANCKIAEEIYEDDPQVIAAVMEIIHRSIKYRKEKG